MLAVIAVTFFIILYAFTVTYTNTIVQIKEYNYCFVIQCIYASVLARYTVVCLCVCLSVCVSVCVDCYSSSRINEVQVRVSIGF